MKILMLTPYLPYPPSSGGQIRSYNLIKHLAKKHEITLYSLIKKEEEKNYVQHLKNYCQKVEVFKRPEKPWTVTNILKTAFSTLPFLVIRNYSARQREALASELKVNQYDIIHAETFYVTPHIPKTTIPIVLVDQTIEYQVYQHYVESFPIPLLRPLLYIDVLKIKYWETYYWKKADRVVAVSESDAQKMAKLVPSLKVDVVPNGVGEDLMENVTLHFSKRILFMGNYAWLQNVEAANILVREVFPKIIKKVPDAVLVIAGQNTDKIQNLKGERVSIVDLKIEDVQGVKKAYQTSGILVAPLYGPGGTRLKILGAMAAKVPVVTTDIGIEGIEAVQGESVLFGKTPEELAKHAVELLMNKDKYQKIAVNARKLVEKKYTYQAIAQKLDTIYKEVKSA